MKLATVIYSDNQAAMTIAKTPFCTCDAPYEDQASLHQERSLRKKDYNQV